VYGKRANLSATESVSPLALKERRAVSLFEVWNGAPHCKGGGTDQRHGRDRAKRRRRAVTVVKLLLGKPGYGTTQPEVPQEGWIVTNPDGPERERDDRHARGTNG
jgi:hypothetical protein